MLNLEQRKELCLILLDNRMTFEVISDRVYIDGAKEYIRRIIPKHYNLVKAEKCCWEVITKDLVTKATSSFNSALHQ